jgi:hypothetical protein
LSRLERVKRGFPKTLTQQEQEQQQQQRQAADSSKAADKTRELFFLFFLFFVATTQRERDRELMKTDSLHSFRAKTQQTQ